MSKKNDQYNQYKTQNVMTASPGELTLMLYDGCLKNMKLGKKHIEEKAYEKANETLQKSEAIVMELISSLDLSYEIGSQMLNLYVFVNDQIVQANIKKDSGLLDFPIELISEFREAWQQVIRQSRIQAYGGAAGVPGSG